MGGELRSVMLQALWKHFTTYADQRQYIHLMVDQLAEKLLPSLLLFIAFVGPQTLHPWNFVWEGRRLGPPAPLEQTVPD